MWKAGIVCSQTTGGQVTQRPAKPQIRDLKMQVVISQLWSGFHCKGHSCWSLCSVWRVNFIHKTSICLIRLSELSEHVTTVSV